MIKNASLYANRLDFRHVWTVPSYPNNNDILFFESINIYITVISETVCLFNNVYI